MVEHARPIALRHFVGDEMLRAPLVVEQTIDGVVDALRAELPRLGPLERSSASDLLQALLARRPRVVAGYVEALGEQVGAGPAREAGAGAAAPAAALSLLDEAEVAADVEISHAIETIRSTAEHELRELVSYTSALAGDPDVGRDHNPLRPEVHARALWAAAQRLPLAFRIAFMRRAAMPLARVLRQSYASAAARLDSQGVQPAVYRTLILPGGARRLRPGETTSSDLDRIRATLPVADGDPAATAGPVFDEPLARTDESLRELPADAAPTERARPDGAPHAHAARRVDQQAIERLSRLFDAIVSDPRLAPDLRLLIARLQTTALRIAVADASMIERQDHPLWSLVERIAFLGETLAAPGTRAREQALADAQCAIDDLAGFGVPDAARIRHTIDRLRAGERQRFDERLLSAAPQIALVQALERREPDAASTLPGAVDVPQLETVPAELLEALHDDGGGSDASSQRWIDGRHPGDWLRLFKGGRWVHAQLLWSGEHGEPWLLQDVEARPPWAMRRRALLMLHRERLLDDLRPRPLLHAAGERSIRRSSARAAGVR
jgi:hypothetical protein